MVSQNALIRRLPAVETLGSVTVICTDKTGTLTEGRMLVERVWLPGTEYQVTGNGFAPSGNITRDGAVIDASTDEPLSRLLITAALCNDAALVAPSDAGGTWDVVGDPTEGALLSLAGKAGYDPARVAESNARVAEVPFDSTRKRMSTVNRSPDSGRLRVATKGAVEAVLEASFDAGETAPEILRRAEQYASDGYRVLAFAGKEIGDFDAAASEGFESGLTFYGLVAMADPPRRESADAVAAARRAGIRPVMITGDHPATGKAIADRLGMLEGASVMTGAELAAEGAGHLADHVEEVGVYARTSPEQKLDIVQAWKAKGQIVAMTGDGVNDAPALQTADIGVTMGITGTDVAKEASDMVLTDDNFATIVAAVAQGRRIYDNIRRFVRYTLTSNTERSG